MKIPVSTLWSTFKIFCTCSYLWDATYFSIDDVLFLICRCTHHTTILFFVMQKTLYMAIHQKGTYLICCVQSSYKTFTELQYSCKPNVVGSNLHTPIKTFKELEITVTYKRRIKRLLYMRRYTYRQLRH